MEILLGILIGAVLGFVTGMLVYNKHRNKIDNVKEVAEEAKDFVDKTKEKLK